MRYVRTTTPANIYSLKPTFIVDRTDVTCFKTHGNKGRYVNDTIETEENLEKWLKYNNTSIIKQADTIEDLCDGLIVEEKGNPNNWFTMEVDEFKNEKEHSKGWTYRAFIKTKEGLIYAAEMNSEGKLKLL